MYDTGTMELNMRYTTAADGVRIAFATAGQGLPLIRAPFAPFSHCQLEWRQGTFFERLSRHRMVIPFDARGTGLSDRSVEDYSLEARKLDIDAIADALTLSRFALHGIGSSGALVISYAVQHPERVSHLILDDAFVNGRAYQERPQNAALGLLAQDWEAMTENLAFMSQGHGGEDARRYAEYLRACTTPEGAARQWRAIAQVDVTDLLPLVKAPTLVMQHQGVRILSPDDGREIAMRIPNARLVVLEGKQGEVDNVLSAIGDFLGDEGSTPAPRHPSAFRTVLFTDIVGHTEMMQRLGDTKGRDVLREHERITRDLLREHGGTEVKTMGDGFMASFDSVTSAVECAIALQRAFASHTESMPEPLRVRVGLNAGEPIEEDGDLFGATVILAARIAANASAGEILVSDVVRSLVAGKGFLFADRGVVSLKGFEEPVRLYEVRWEREPT
jgi:class 3 adenylate cyclase/pimeloyl-ACP methyl ester carboxylesterase